MAAPPAAPDLPPSCQRELAWQPAVLSPAAILSPLGWWLLWRAAGVPACCLFSSLPLKQGVGGPAWSLKQRGRFATASAGSAGSQVLPDGSGGRHCGGNSRASNGLWPLGCCVSQRKVLLCLVSAELSAVPPGSGNEPGKLRACLQVSKQGGSPCVPPPL